MKKIGVIGLGYVGLPLLIAASKKYIVKGYDNDLSRIDNLKKILTQMQNFQKTN